MKLVEFLQALRECPDEEVEGVWRLTSQLGVNDNWPIFLKYDPEEFIKFLETSERYRVVERIGWKKGDMCTRLDYTQGIVKIQVFDFFNSSFATGSIRSQIPQIKAHYKRQERDYNMTLLLHDYQEKKIEGVNSIRAIARVIDDLGQLILRKGIPACLTRTRPADAPFEDCSYIVYHP